MHHVSVRSSETAPRMTRGTANANASLSKAGANPNVANANASANRPAESLVTQYANAFRYPNMGSDPICQPGTEVQLGDGQMHSCQ